MPARLRITARAGAAEASPVWGGRRAACPCVVTYLADHVDAGRLVQRTRMQPRQALLNPARHPVALFQLRELRARTPYPLLCERGDASAA